MTENAGTNQAHYMCFEDNNIRRYGTKETLKGTKIFLKCELFLKIASICLTFLGL